MVITGRVENGVVVLPAGTTLPEGAEVSVVVPGATKKEPTVGSLSAYEDENLPEAERQRIREVLDRIAALPIEGSTEPFSGADHDKVLYGKP